jgi:hypothetical protein
MLANTVRDDAQRPEPFQPHDFSPFHQQADAGSQISGDPIDFLESNGF